MLASWSIPLLVMLATAPSAADRASAIQVMNQGVEQARDGELEQAETTILRALRLDPSAGEAWLNLGHVRERQGRQGDAAEAFTEGLKVSEGALAQEHRFLLARVELRQAAPLDHEPRVARTKEILARLKTVVKAQPRHAAAWHRVAQCHEFLEELTDADAAYRRAIELDPTRPEPYVGLAMMYIDYGYPNVAMAILDVNTQVNDRRVEAWLGQGRAYARLERPAEAIKALGKALALDPGNVRALYGLGMAHAELRHRPEAIEMLEAFHRAPSDEVPENLRLVANQTLARLRDPI